MPASNTTSSIYLPGLSTTINTAITAGLNAGITAEAIAAGVIVITYALGAVPEYFSDGCVFLNFPHGTDMEKMMTEKVTCDAQYMDYTGNVKDKLLEVEHTPGLKEEIRNRAKNTIKDRFSISVVGKMWEDLINEF